MRAVLRSFLTTGVQPATIQRGLIVAAAAVLAGCSTCEPVKVPVPVPCRVAMPQRPQMPTEALDADVSLDDFVAAAAAEIERREGYELQLRAALQACQGQ